MTTPPKICQLGVVQPCLRAAALERTIRFMRQSVRRGLARAERALWVVPVTAMLAVFWVVHDAGSRLQREAFFGLPDQDGHDGAGSGEEPLPLWVIVFAACYHIAFALLTGTYLACALGDPGRVTAALSADLACALSSARVRRTFPGLAEEDGGGLFGASSGALELSMDKEARRSGGGGTLTPPQPPLSPRWPFPAHLRPSQCSRCSLWRPPRAHHCRACGACVLKQDHHWCAAAAAAAAERVFFVYFIARLGHAHTFHFRTLPSVRIAYVLSFPAPSWATASA